MCAGLRDVPNTLTVALIAPPSCHAVRGDVPKDTSEVFFRKVKFWNKEQGLTEPPPVFNVDGVNYLYIKKGSLYMVATTKVRNAHTRLAHLDAIADARLL